MGWQVAFSSLLLCGGALCRPNLLGAARGFPFQQNHLNQRHHGHESHRQGHSLDVSPLDGLYGAPAELPSYGDEELPAYNIPAAASASAPNPSIVPAVGKMLMDPSYYFEYKSADGERMEDADSTGAITGSYGYKTAGGNDILVKYSAGAEKGFVIENMEELQATLERTSSEAALVIAKPYSGETVEVEYVGPNVDPTSQVQDASYRYGYKVSDKSQDEEADASGNVKGSYSFKTADGQDFEVKYTAGVGGFVVENLDELLEKSNPQSAEYAAIVAEHAALASSGQAVVAARSESGSSPSAEAYVHEEIAAEPYVHEEIEAETYIHEEVPYVHEEIAAQPYIYDEGSSLTGSTAPGYNFAYSNENSEREETADSNGKIQGSYKIINAEGNAINVVYEAGSGIGFVVKNQDDLNAAVSKATADGAIVAAARKSETSAASAAFSHSASSTHDTSAASSYSASALPLPGYGGASPNSVSTFALPESKSLPSYGRRRVAVKKQQVAASTQNSDSTAQTSGRALMDASFMFNAIGDDHEFMETADIAGERIGSYSYVNPEGDNFVVKYTAGKNGFVILNPRDVLPQAPVV